MGVDQFRNCGRKTTARFAFVCIKIFIQQRRRETTRRANPRAASANAAQPRKPRANERPVINGACRANGWPKLMATLRTCFWGQPRVTPGWWPALGAKAKPGQGPGFVPSQDGHLGLLGLSIPGPKATSPKLTPKPQRGRARFGLSQFQRKHSCLLQN